MIIIDAGHGGKDPGAVGNKLQEKDIALRISLTQKRLCEIYNIPHYLTREKDTYISLQERTRVAKQKNQLKDKTILISNHINSSEGIAKGFEIIKKHSDHSQYANNLLKLVQRSDILSIRKVYSKLNKSNQDYFHMVRDVPFRSYILEWGFIKNSQDMQSLQNNLTVAATLPIIAYLQDKDIQKVQLY